MKKHTSLVIVLLIVMLAATAMPRQAMALTPPKVSVVSDVLIRNDQVLKLACKVSVPSGASYTESDLNEDNLKYQWYLCVDGDPNNIKALEGET